MKSRRKHAEAYTSGRALLAISAAALTVLVALYLATRLPAYSTWMQSPANVIETRVVNAGFFSGGYTHPGTALYRAEAHVTYTADGRLYDEWLPTSETFADKEWLTFRLSQHSSAHAVVTWNPRDPAQGRVNLRLPYR